MRSIIINTRWVSHGIRAHASFEVANKPSVGKKASPSRPNEENPCGEAKSHETTLPVHHDRRHTSYTTRLPRLKPLHATATQRLKHGNLNGDLHRTALQVALTASTSSIDSRPPPRSWLYIYLAVGGSWAKPPPSHRCDSRPQLFWQKSPDAPPN